MVFNLQLPQMDSYLLLNWFFICSEMETFQLDVGVGLRKCFDSCFMLQMFLATVGHPRGC